MRAPPRPPTAGLEAPDGDWDHPVVRLGLGEEDEPSGSPATRPTATLEDLARRSGLTRPQLEALASAGSAASLDGRDRRRTLLPSPAPDTSKGSWSGPTPRPLPAMTEAEEVVADLWTTGVTTETSLTELARSYLDERGVTTAAALLGITGVEQVIVAGLVTHRQWPETDGEGCDLHLVGGREGPVNVVCSVGVWARHRRAAQSAAAKVVWGRVEAVYGWSTWWPNGSKHWSWRLPPGRAISRDLS